MASEQGIGIGVNVRADPDSIKNLATAVSQLNTEIERTQSVGKAGQEGIESLATALRRGGASVEEMRNGLQNLGFSTKEINAALQPYIQNEERLAVIRAKNAQAAQEDAAIAEKSIAAYKELTGASNQKNIALDKQAEAHTRGKDAADKHSTGIHSMWSQSFLFFGVAMGVNSAIQQIAASQEEKANPAMVQFGRIMQEVSSGAMVGMMSGLGTAGMLLGAFAGLAVGAGIALFTIDHQTAELNKQLDTLAKKDDVIATLAKIADVSYEDAQAMLEVAKASPEAAKSLQQYVDSARDMSIGEILLTGLAAYPQAISRAIESTDGLSAAWQDLTKYIGAAWNQLTGFMQTNAQAMSGRDALADYAKKMFEIQQDAQKYKETFKDLDTAFASASKKDNAADMLAQITGASRENAEAVIKAASAHTELAGKINGAIKEYISLSAAIYEANKSGNQSVDGAEQIARAQARLGVVTQELTEHYRNLSIAMMAEDYQKMVVDKERDAAQKQVDAWQESYQKQIDARSQYNDEAAKLARDHQKRLDEIDFNTAQGEIKYQQDVTRANREMGDALEKAAQSLADKEATIRRELGDKQASEYESYRKKVQDIDESVVKAHADYAQKISEIDRKEVEDLASLDWQTGQDLQKAKTDNEREQISERALHERALIRQRATDERTDAARRVSEEEEVSTKKKQLALEEYNYKRSLDERDANQRIADAQRQYNEAVAQARKANEQRLDDLRTAHDNELRQIAHQREVERQANVDRVNDLAQRLQREMEMVKARYLMEIQAIIDTQIKARQAWMELEGIASASHRDADAVTSYTMGEKFGTTALTKRAMGGDVVGGRNYLVGENGMEILRLPVGTSGTVIPNHQVSNSYGGNSITIQINGARDPGTVAEEVRKVLESEIWR